MHLAKNRRSFIFEALETRRMLDGNCIVTQSGNTLLITGTSADNSIVVTNSSPNVVEIFGLNTLGTGGTQLPTLINGATSAKTFSGVSNIIVDFGSPGTTSGNDSVVLTNLTLNGQVGISAGDGNTFIGVGDFDNSGHLVDSAVNSSLGPVSLLLGLAINMGGGANTVTMNHAALHSAASQDLTITCGDGSSTYTFKNTIVYHTALFNDSGSVSMTFDNFTANTLNDNNTGNGNDQFQFTGGSHVVFTTTLNTGIGNDTVDLDGFTGGSIILNLGPGNNQVTAENNTALLNIARIFGGDNADTVHLSDFSSAWLNVSLGSGGNTITASHVTVVNTTTLVAGYGTATNSIQVDHLTANSLYVHTGAGNDNVTLSTVAITNGAVINMEAGDDLLTLDGFSSLSIQVILLNGNDSLELHNTTITNNAILGGGLGSDTYTDNGGNTFGTPRFANFETNIGPPVTEDFESGGAIITSGSIFGTKGTSGTLTLGSGSITTNASASSDDTFAGTITTNAA